MRRNLCTLALAGLGLAVSGCIVVSKGTVTGLIPSHQAVAIDGNLYIVEVATGKVARVSKKAIEEAEPFEGISSTTVNVTVEHD